MKRIKTIGLALVAVFALSAVVAASASAAAPEFSPATEQGFTSSSGTSVLTAGGAGGTVITCTASSGAGRITGAKTVAGVSVTFTGCTAKSKGTCEVHSTGAGKEEIKTGELNGELGKVAKKEATSKVGLDLKAVSGSFVTVEGTCIPFEKSSVSGSVIGEVTPVAGGAGTSGKLTYALEKEKQKIQMFEGGSKDTLSVFGFVESTQQSEEAITFEKAVEVT